MAALPVPAINREFVAVIANKKALLWTGCLRLFHQPQIGVFLVTGTKICLFLPAQLHNNNNNNNIC